MKKQIKNLAFYPTSVFSGIYYDNSNINLTESIPTAKIPIIIGIAAKNKTPTPLLKYVLIPSKSLSATNLAKIGKSGTKNAVTKIPTGNWKTLLAYPIAVHAPSEIDDVKNIST